MRVCLALVFFGIATANAGSVIQDCGQLLVVTTDSWSAQMGQMNLFERAANSEWRKRGSTINVRIGRAGLAWGRGIVDTSALEGPIKREADDRAPAGVFRLGPVFGAKAETKMPFITLSPSVVAVDDSRSRYYNQVVDATKIENRDWKHAEKLFGVDVYRLGIVVQHNMPPKPGAGSCIFLHIWKDKDTSTSGCTATSERGLIRIVQWLVPEKNPLLVQLPRIVYDQLHVKWHLP